jgi:hypothetical protein
MPTLSRLGYHYYPDDRHFTQKDLAAWLPILASLGARWLTLRASPSRAVPESFIRGLCDAGVVPIVHLAARVGDLNAAQLAPLFASYARWGVHQVVVFDRPNQQSAWEAADWGKPSLVERFTDRLIPLLQAQREVGLQPVFPPLEPGGDYWDTAFLAAALASLARRGQQALLRETALAIYAWTFDRPLDWGSGGPSRWPEARPYHTPEGSQDQRGFRIFEWYAQIAAVAASAALPMFVIAGGALPSPAPAGLGSDPHAENNVAVARALASDEVPALVQAFCFYLLAAEPGSRDHRLAWFPTLDAPRPVVDAMRGLVAQPVKPGDSKSMRHYLLLPQRAERTTLKDWAALGEYALVFRPTIGFSVEEASHAAQVTILGDEGAVPAVIESELRAAGCAVQRVVRPPESSTQVSTGGDVHG